MKGYQVNIKGNNQENKRNSVTTEMESVEAKPVNALKSDNMAQASLSNEITEADMKTNPTTPFAKESTTSKKAEREMKTTPLKTQIETSEKLSKHRFSKKYRGSSNFVVPANTTVASGGESLLLYIILGIIIPPLAVGLLYGIGTEFWISLVLTIIIWLPGAIYALIKVFQKF